MDLTMMERVSDGQEKMEGYCSTSQSPQRTVVPVEEEEEEEEMHYFSPLFGKELYMFRTDLLSIIRSLNTVYTATGICHAVMLTVC
jgi:hypothetical protein